MRGESGAAPGAETAARGPFWRAPLVMFLALFVVFGLTSTRGVASTDDHAPAVEAWRIASSGSPWLEDVLDHHIQKNPFLHKVPNGHVVADRMAGPVIICVPFYRLLDRDPRPAAFSIVAGGIAAAFLTAGSVTLMFLALRRRLGSLLGAAVALAFALATPTWSVSADGPWTHTVTQFGLSGAAYGASRRSWLMTGAFLGVGMLGRPHLALVAAVLGLGMSWCSRSLRPVIQVAVPTLCSLGFLMLWNRWMFGVWTIASVGYTGHGQALVGGRAVAPELIGADAQLLNVLGFFFAPDRGFLVWTPVVLVLLPAVARGWLGTPVWSRWLAFGGLVYTAAQLRMDVFTGGDSFYGYRNALELLTCLVPLFAFALPWVGRAGRVFVPLVVSLQASAIIVGATASAMFVSQERVWRDNSFLMAIRSLPGPMSIWIALCLSVGMLGAHLARHQGNASPEASRGCRRVLERVE